MCAKRTHQYHEVLPVELTKDSHLYNYRGPIIIGAHYPIMPVSEEDGYVYINEQPLCEGPLILELTFKDNAVFIGLDCATCGLHFEPTKTSFAMKHEWFQSVDRWMIDAVESRFDSQVTCPRVNLKIVHTIHPSAPLLPQQPIPLVLVTSNEMYFHATVAYSRVTKSLLEITRNASGGVRKILGYK